MLKRTGPGFHELLRSQLRRSDGWIYETFESEREPFVRDHLGRAVFAEISHSYEVSGPASDPDWLRATAQKLTVVEASHDRELIPAVSERANLVVIPREGFRERVLHRLFSNADPLDGAYFIRYPTGSGEAAFRLRYLRPTESGAAMAKDIEMMTASGWLLEIEERSHSLEHERYGGPSVFPLFTMLFSCESTVIAQLGDLKSDDPLTERLHLPLLDWWLDLFPAWRTAIVDFAVQNNAADRAVQKHASALMRNTDPKERTTEIPEIVPAAISATMKRISAQIATHPIGTYELQSAAHLFCNRLGISTDREKALWIALNKIERKRSHDNSACHQHNQAS